MMISLVSGKRMDTKKSNWKQIAVWTGAIVGSWIAFPPAAVVIIAAGIYYGWFHKDQEN